jgi:hypothetical protein
VEGSQAFGKGPLSSEDQSLGLSGLAACSLLYPLSPESEIFVTRSRPVNLSGSSQVSVECSDDECSYSFRDRGRREDSKELDLKTLTKAS